MSKVKATQRLQLEDIPQEHRPWMTRVIQTINDYVDQSIKILNGGSTFSDQEIGKEHVFDFTYQSDAISFPVGFLWPYATSPRSLLVVSATEDNEPVIVAVSWEFTEKGQVQLARVVKFTTAPAVSLLTATKRYKIRVRVTP